jgi:N-acetyl-anhydromuramyl-L-alanine amidase AmpD
MSGCSNSNNNDNDDEISIQAFAHDELLLSESSLSSLIESESNPEPDYHTALQTTDMPFPLENSAERAENAEITHIVLHFMSNVAANRDNPYDINENHEILLNSGTSAHYIIDRDGIIYFAVPENRAAYHAGAGSLEDYPHYENKLNQYSIGIELLGIGTKEEMAQYLSGSEYDRLDPAHIGFTEAQYQSFNELVSDILSRHSTIQPNRRHIIGHDEYAPNRKTDPGALFDWDRLLG